MKKLLPLLLLGMVAHTTSPAQLLKKLGDKVKDKVNQRAEQKTDNAIDKGLDKTEQGAKDAAKGNTAETKSADGGNTKQADAPATTAVSFKTYANYDFVPGDTVLFEDNFMDDQDGEFPAHWTLDAGQAIINKISNAPAFCLTEGNYVRVYPRMKTAAYLTDPFTVEFDYYAEGGGYGPIVFLKFTSTDGSAQEGHVHFSESGEVSTSYFSKNFSDQYPSNDNKTFTGQWHHAAMVYKNNQLKCYIDQYRILVCPSLDAQPLSFGFGGIGDKEHPIVFKNVRVARGGKMNLVGKKFTESKIITHGINFDVNKAIIKPESMGTLNMIVKVMTDNPDVKFEVGGHTDSDGSDDANMKLSQQRADAVKEQLIKMGIDAGRLTAKGYGETKPISDNTTPEGKANNRRVEFVKM